MSGAVHPSISVLALTLCVCTALQSGCAVRPSTTPPAGRSHTDSSERARLATPGELSTQVNGSLADSAGKSTEKVPMDDVAAAGDSTATVILPPGPPASQPVVDALPPPGPPVSQSVSERTTAPPGPRPLATPVLATVPRPSGPPATYRRSVGTYLSPKSPANRYSSLSPQSCRAQLKRLKLPLRWESSTSGIANPVRLTGALNSVAFVAPPRSVPFGLLDCRLVLILRDFASVLQRHGVIKVKVDNYYRPGARLGSGRRSQHSYGLAIDILEFVLKDGTVLDVEDDYRGKRGQASCGAGASVARNHARGVRLRNILCDAARAGLFHHMLTPNYDAAHRNHFHFDIKRGAKTLWVK